MTDNTQELDVNKLERIIADHNKEMRRDMASEITGGTRSKSVTDVVTVKALLGWHNKQETKLLDALYWMYTQYCAKDGHLFMGAGEEASELLENAGYITTDGAGRVINDNGDSFEQRNELKERDDDQL